MIGRRGFLQFAAAGSLAAIGCSRSLMGRRASAPGETAPNIILILADDLGYETVGSYGSTTFSTPQLDRLASEGIRFSHCYSTPLCTPSRVQLLTGRPIRA